METRKIGLRKWFIWIGCCAFHLAIVRVCGEDHGTLSGAAIALVNSLLIGACWTTGVLLATGRLTDRQGIIQPGHLLLTLLGVVAICDVFVNLVLSHEVFRRPEVVVLAATCWLYVLPLFLRHLDFRWKAFFAALVAIHGTAISFASLSLTGIELARDIDLVLTRSFPYFANACILGMLVSTVYLDHKAAARRDWLHGVGVTVFACVTIIRFLFVGG